MILVITSIIILLLVNVLIIFSLKRMNQKSKKETDYVNISVIIAARNEAENIPDLIKSLKDLDYPEKLFEIIIVDDNSNDGTLDMLNNYSNSSNNLSVFSLEKDLASGKRNALSIGISKSKYKNIMITDADCRPEKNWLKSYSEFFSNDFNFLFGVASFYQHKDIVNKISCFENLRNSILSFSMALIGLPYSAAARSFGFTKTAFDSIGGYTGTIDTISGDDDLLLREAVKKNKKIGVVTNNNSAVYSESKRNLVEYFQQKARHTQTSFFYLIKHKLLLGFWHLLNLFFLFSPILMIINPLFGILFPSKLIMDLAIVKSFQKKFGYKFAVYDVLYLQIIYELFLIVHFINARFSKVQWK